MPEGTAWTPADYKLQFFTPAENELVDQLTEIIIPADAHSPGAHAAQVSLFADLMVATSNDAVKGAMARRFAIVSGSCGKILAHGGRRASCRQRRTPFDRTSNTFLFVLKGMTVNGYYTSEIGIHKELEYVGNHLLWRRSGLATLGVGDTRMSARENRRSAALNFRGMCSGAA